MTGSSWVADRTSKKLWAKLATLFEEERKTGVLAVSQIPSSILAHAPGYIVKASEIIVGLQTDMNSSARRARRSKRAWGISTFTSATSRW